MKFFLLQSISGAHWVYCIFFCWGPLAAQGTLYVLTSRVFGQPRWLLRALGALTPNLGVAYPQPWSYLPPTLEVKTPRGGNFLSGCRKFRGVVPWCLVRNGAVNRSKRTFLRRRGAQKVGTAFTSVVTKWFPP